MLAVRRRLGIGRARLGGAAKVETHGLVVLALDLPAAGGDPPRRALAAINFGREQAEQPREGATAAPVVYTTRGPSASQPLARETGRLTLRLVASGAQLVLLDSRRPCYHATLRGLAPLVRRAPSDRAWRRPKATRMNRDRIGKYEILGELGRGTMGEVYKALDPVLNRHVALKTLSVRVGPDEEALERFQREARAAAVLKHPNIVTIHDFGEADGRLFMAMEFLDGHDLRDAIDRDSLPSLDRKLEVVDAVLAALDYAHAKGVIHRDVKPANIFIEKDGSVKIMDFGLAKMSTSNMTQDGIVLGTPNYMSPEQALGDRVDVQSDVFSVGAVFYELLTGHKPFEADSTPSVLFQVVHREPPAVTRWAPDVPGALVEVVDRALVKDKKRRYATAAEMRAALARAREAVRFAATGTSAPPVLPPAERSRPPQGSSPSLSRPRRAGSLRGGRTRARSGLVPAAWGGGLAILALVVVAGLWLRGGRAPTPPREIAQVGELTRALVATQVQLAQRELDDKNWAAAATQAESALKLAPGHPQAARTLEEARARMRELTEAIAAARRALASGDTGTASQQLSHVLELDPRHPAAAELSKKLNDVFHTQADEAATSMKAARAEAVAAEANRTPDFAAADGTVKEGEDLLARGEFADAARTFLEARDAFDRARRAVVAARTPASTSSPSTGLAVDESRGGPSAAATSRPAASHAASPRSPVGALPAPSAKPSGAGPPAVPARRFVTDATTVTTPDAGQLQGFETEDVKTRRTPRFTGRMEFEVLPPEVRPGNPFVVHVVLVNEGRQTVRVRGIELATVADGQRTPVPARILQKEVTPRSRALVAEYSAVWSDTGSWELEAEITADGDERVRSRLRSN
jgi:serine/threonine protein kinase